MLAVDFIPGCPVTLQRLYCLFVMEVGNGRRPHRSLELRPPGPITPVVDLLRKRIKRRPVLGGLLIEYERTP